jgi:hypothetical protein
MPIRENTTKRFAAVAIVDPESDPVFQELAAALSRSSVDIKICFFPVLFRSMSLCPACDVINIDEPYQDITEFRLVHVG